MAEAQKEILESIRDIIGNKDDDIIDLTEVVDAPKPKPINLFETSLDEDEGEETDILSEIDALLGDEKPKIEKSAAQKPISTPDSEIELADFEPQITRAPAPEAQIAGDDIMDTDNPESLISPESADNATQALKTLLSSVSKANQPKVQSAPFRNGDTVEDLVMDMLKPFLKEWLDTNLPKLVQNIVEKEIKRLIPKE